MMKTNYNGMPNSNIYNRNEANSTNVKQMRSIRVELTVEEYEMFSKQAKEQKIFKRCLARTRLLDTQEGVKGLRDRLIRGLPGLHSLVDQIEDPDLQRELRERMVTMYGDL